VPAPAPPEPAPKRRVWPLVTLGLVAADVGIHLLVTAGLVSVESWSLVPYFYKTALAQGGLPALAAHSWTLVSSMFVHAGWSHLLSNMSVLLPVGAVVERAVGHWRTLATFLGAGLLGGILWTAAVWSGPAVGGLGASGAIMGLAGVFLPLAARAWLHMPGTDWRTFVKTVALGWVGAVLLLQFGADVWGAYQQFAGTLQAAGGHETNHFVHLVGFAWGLAASGWWALRRRRAAKTGA
jgi:membrane associated rhomboid family serine protease